MTRSENGIHFRRNHHVYMTKYVTLYISSLRMFVNNDMNVFRVLNSHSHVMYILRILLAKYSEVKVLLKQCKITAYTKLSTTKVWRLKQFNQRQYTL